MDEVIPSRFLEESTLELLTEEASGDTAVVIENVELFTPVVLRVSRTATALRMLSVLLT